VRHSAILTLHSAVFILALASSAHAQRVPGVPSGAFLGIGVAAPAQVVDLTAQQLFHVSSAEEFLRAWRLRADDRGALVIQVLPGHAADRFGIILGDLITAVNGVEVPDPDEFPLMINAMHPGDEVALTLLRAGREKQIAVRLGTRPPEYPLFVIPRAETFNPGKPPPAPDGTLLVDPESALKAMEEAFGHEPAAQNPLYDEAVKLYRGSRVARAEGLLLAAPIALGPGETGIAHAGDEVLRVAGRPVATPTGFSSGLLERRTPISPFVTLEVRAEGSPETRTLKIEAAGDAAPGAAARFFTDEDRIFLWLLDFFPADSAKNAEEQAALRPMPADSRFVFPAVVITQPVTLHYDAKDASDSQRILSQELRCVPGDILVSAQWMQPGAEGLEDSVLWIHDGQRAWIEGENWNPRAADLAAGGQFRSCDWCRPARLQARQILECVVGARALRLTELGENAAALLSAAHPDSSEAAALRAHDRAIRLAAMRARLCECVAAGDGRSAGEAARGLLSEDPQGRYGLEAAKFIELVNASAADRTARAEKLLADGDVAGARREVSPLTLVVPEDARLAAVLGRCDDLDTLRAGRRALEQSQLRRARLLAEAVLARDPKGVEARAAQQFLDDVRAAAKSRTDRANRYLDQGDAESARDELAPALQAFPDDPAAQAAWTRARQPPKTLPPQK
jgi:hypothetical protein